MTNITISEISFFLKGISTYLKNLIIYKASESGKDRAHIRSLKPILERRSNEFKRFYAFFNGNNESIIMQLLNYLIRCGEIIDLQKGYYAVLPTRQVQLPVSKKILEVGQLKEGISRIINVGLAVPIIQADDRPITLKDYRYDFSIKEYLELFQTTQKDIHLINEEYYKPDKNRFIKIFNEKNLEEGKIYYVKSHPYAWNEVECFIARKENGHWKGEKVKHDLRRVKLALLVNQGYQPTYRIDRLNKVKNTTDIFQIILSDQLPKAEEEQVFLFSLPNQLYYCKKYYVQHDYLRDFINVLSNLGFIEESSK